MGETYKKKAFICPTTHWDREWVMTFGQFRVRLVNLIDNLLNIMDNYSEFIFYLDGQAAVLDDYLEIKPENKEKISGYLKTGRLAAGPWYVLADQFLQSGEAAIRNLTLGMAAVKKLGGEPLMIGYIPDSFGSIASLPMILNGVGITSATFGRGRPYWNEDLPNTEFIWEHADGSSVLAINHGYGNGLFLSYLDIWTNIFTDESYNPDFETIFKTFMNSAAAQEKAAALPALYFSVGADHMEPRKSLPGLVEYINANQNQYELVFGTPADYINYIQNDTTGVNNLRTYKGELLGTYRDRIFQGTFTSRIKMKQLNDMCDILLSRELEPLYVMASLGAGIEYPRGHLNDLWRQYILNHPHDSICGCNIDQVNRDMRNRNDYILNTGDYLRKEALDLLIKTIDTSGVGGDDVPVVVMNPLGHDRGGRVRGLVRVPKRFKHAGYELYDGNGDYIPSRIIHVTDKNQDLESVYMTPEMLSEVISKNAGENIPDDQVFTVLDVDFIAHDIPSTGYKTYTLKPAAPKENFASAVSVSQTELENEYIKVNFNDNATFDITDKKSGQVYKNMNYFADREEAGDAYQHLEFDCPDERDTKNIKTKWELSEYREHGAAFETGFDFYLPENIKDGKRSKVAKPVSITIKAALYAGLDHLGVTVKINNTCEDHCFRVVFDTGIDTDVSYAFDHFNIIERPVDSGELAWRENPFTEFVCVSAADKHKNFCVSTKGLPAYEVVRYNGGARLYIELLRATGSVGSPAGANYPAPEAQCIGEHIFEYAIFPNAVAETGLYLEKAVNYRNDLLAAGGSSHTGTLPDIASFISINSKSKSESEGDDIKPYISCLKREENGDGVMLRLWNPGKTQTVKISGLINPREIWSATLDGIKIELLSSGEMILREKKLSTFIIIT